MCLSSTVPTVFRQPQPAIEAGIMCGIFRADSSPFFSGVSSSIFAVNRYQYNGFCADTHFMLNDTELSWLEGRYRTGVVGLVGCLV